MDLAVATAFAWREKVQVKVRCTNCVCFCGKSEQRGLLVNHTQSKIFGRFATVYVRCLTSQRMMHMKGEVQVQKFQTTEMTTNDPIIER